MKKTQNNVGLTRFVIWSTSFAVVAHKKLIIYPLPRSSAGRTLWNTMRTETEKPKTKSIRFRRSYCCFFLNFQEVAGCFPPIPPKLKTPRQDNEELYSREITPRNIQFQKHCSTSAQFSKNQYLSSAISRDKSEIRFEWRCRRSTDFFPWRILSFLLPWLCRPSVESLNPLCFCANTPTERKCSLNLAPNALPVCANLSDESCSGQIIHNHLGSAPSENTSITSLATFLRQ